MFKVLKPGLLTTIQDEGRFGHRSIAIPQSGALDISSFHRANQLIGNILNAPAMEVLIFGGRYLFLNNCKIAIVGAEVEVSINDVILQGSVFEIKKGDMLKIGSIKKGFAAYLAVNGGFKAEKYLGSYATLLAIKKGGHKGRNLKKGDVLETANFYEKHAAPAVEPTKNQKYISIFKGPEFIYLTAASKKALNDSQFIVTSQSNRMGFRLKGEHLSLIESKTILSSPVLPGTIQLLPDGQLIVLLNDGQTTGGYPRIGQIAKKDIGTFVQKGINGFLQFQITFT